MRNESPAWNSAHDQSLGQGRYRGLRERVKSFALRIINLYVRLPSKPAAQVLGKQLLRSGTSVGAHYCEGHRAKSRADFISKMEGGMQELEETLYWLELLVDSDIVDRQRVQPLIGEASELTAIFVSIVVAAKSRKASFRE